MSGTSMFDVGGQPNVGKLPVEGGTLENSTPIVETIVENAQEEREKSSPNDVSEQNLEEIVKELDESEEQSSSAAKHSLEEDDNPYIETIDTAEMKETPTKKNCNCEMGDLCFKCILSKVFSLEPLFDTAEPIYEAMCLDHPEQFSGVAGADFSAICKFKNSGQIAWPVNVQLKLVNGTIVVYNALGLENQCVQPDEELNVTIELKMPTTPGKYILSFRLVYGDNQEFGEEVTVNLLAYADDTDFATECIPRGYNFLNQLEQPLNETSGNTFYVDQDERDEDGDSVNDLDLSVNSWIMVRDDEEGAASDPPGSEKQVCCGDGNCCETQVCCENNEGCCPPPAEKKGELSEEVQRNCCN